MELVLDTLLAGFPYFISHFGLTLLMLGAGIYIYEKVTPYNELALIRDGNKAAAISLAAGILGLAIPLAECLKGSISLWDIFIWGIVILIVQIMAFFLANLVIDDLNGRIERDELGPAILLFAGKISIGLINAAAISDKM